MWGADIQRERYRWGLCKQVDDLFGEGMLGKFQRFFLKIKRFLKSIQYYMLLIIFPFHKYIYVFINYELTYVKHRNASQIQDDSDRNLYTVIP